MKKVNRVFMAILVTTAALLFYTSGYSTAEKELIAQFEKKYCSHPGAYAVVRNYSPTIKACPSCINSYYTKDVDHQRIGTDMMVYCMVNSKVAFTAACKAKGGEVYRKRNAIQVHIIPWASANYHDVCTVK